MAPKNFRLLKILWERRMSQCELAREISASEAWVSRIINGFIEPSPDDVRRICTLLKVTPPEIGFKRKGEAHGQPVG